MQAHGAVASAVKLAVYVALALLLLVGIAHGQTASSDRLTVGGSKIRPDSATTVRLDGLATTGGTLVLLTDADGDVTERVLANGDIPAPFTRDDVAETITQAWTFSAGITGPLSVTTSLASPIGTFSTRVTTPLITTASGSLTLDPVGDIVLDPGGDDIVPAVNYGPNMGLPSLKYKSLSVGELFVETLVAQERITTMGGRFTVTPSNVLTRDMSAVTSTMCVKYNSFMLHVGSVEYGSKLFMEKNGQIEAFVVLDLTVPTVDPTFGDYCYSVFRDNDGTGANTWLAGDGIIDSGKTGSGMIDQFAVRGLTSASIEGPSIDFLVRTSIAWNGLEQRASIGNLNGRYGFATDTFGFAAGEAAGANLIATAGSVKLRHGTTDKIVLDGSTGDFTLTGDILLSTGGNIESTGNFSITGTNGLLFQNAASTADYPRMIRWASGAYLAGQAGPLQIRSALGTGSSYGAVTLIGVPSVGGQINLETSNGTSASIAYLLAHSTGSTFYAGTHIPVDAAGNVSDGVHTLGLSVARYANIHLALPNDTGATYVVVGNSSVDATRLAYIAGFTGTKTIRNAAGSGTCTLVYQTGILTGGTC